MLQFAHERTKRTAKHTRPQSLREEESFEPEKLLQSLRSAGADDAMANEISRT